MHYALPYKTKQFFFVLIKLSIVIGAGYFIYQKLITNPDLDFNTFIQLTSKNGILSLKNSIILVVLSFLNWFLEIIKWQYLASVVKKISFKDALHQSLGALTASLFTPNRIGEYGAKAIFYNKPYRKKILLVNLLSNIMQMSITLALGIIGFSIYSNSYDIAVNYYKIARFLTLLLTIIVLIILGITQKRYKIKGISIQRIRDFVMRFPKSKLHLGILLSLGRYLIFSFQFFVILYFFKVNITYLEAIPVITSMYLITSILPSIFIFDVVIKGSVAVYLFSLLGINDLIILSTITIMWLLNFVIPSIFGSFYVLNFKFSAQN
ncbi:lysylphosphatidylglycerol synthase domain-containing protein [Hyunsoonleella sp. 2307UL5-6]|uniref:lysylphosphatidylglycerol synthase domain-containing protein n=1 Tax=Hyunsoonleella sp. 2307UL5-6 TaxID=3384768 RepID=UPI0039BCCD3E